MEQIIFHTNLKYIIAGLTREQKGLLLETLLDGAENGDLNFTAAGKNGDLAEHDAAAFSVVDETVANIGRYIMLQQKDIAAKRQRMRDIGAKGGAARKRNANAGENGGGAGDMPDLFAAGSAAGAMAGTERAAGSAAGAMAGTERVAGSAAGAMAGTEGAAGSAAGAMAGTEGAAGDALSDDSMAGGYPNDAQAQLRHCCAKRKEAKENKNILNNKNNLFSGKQILMSALQRPTVAEVQAFVTAEGLNVDAATFVDFYDSHGWCVGRTAIKNWKATARLWHRRACNETSGNYADGRGVSQSVMRTAKNMTDFDDEGYWSELEGRVAQGTENADAVSENGGEVNAATGYEASARCEVSAGGDVSAEYKGLRRLPEGGGLQENRELRRLPESGGLQENKELRG